MDFIEDAFLTDKKQHTIYGIDINSQHTNITEYNNNDMPESKSNIVSSMKYEQNLDNNVINLIAVCDSYLCYTVRSTLLRVINTITSEKALLRGHNYKIINLKFSSENNCNTLCSVDNNNTDTNTDHIFIWQLTSTNTLATSIINSFKLPASYIVPHPIRPYVWLIGYNGDISSTIGLVYNTTNSSAIKSYTDLPVHTSLKSTIIGNDTHILVY